MEFASLMFLATLLGFKHSYDADHLVAVSSMLRRVRSMGAAVRIGMSWAFGHMLTATIITVLLFFFRQSILSIILPHFEKIVGLMLIGLGAFSLTEIFFRTEVHTHEDTAHAHVAGGKKHTHRYMFGVGIIHGLASNDELLTFFIASLGILTIGGLLAGLAFFTVGVVAGMVVFCALFSVPWLHLRSEAAYKMLAIGTGSISIVYGLYMFFNVL